MVLRRLVIPSQGETGADLTSLFHSRVAFRLCVFIYTSLNLSWAFMTARAGETTGASWTLLVWKVCFSSIHTPLHWHATLRGGGCSIHLS